MMEPKRVAVNGITTQTGESKPVTVTRKLISILLAMVLAAGVLVVMPLGALGAEKIALNSPKSVTLSGGNYAEFSFTPTRTSSYKLESTGSYDTKAELYLASNIDGYFISIDDDGGSGTNFALTYTLQAGIEYVYRVFFYSSSTSGSFSIKLSEIHSHNYGAWLITTNETCVATGIRTRKCTICGAEETENVNSTGHTWNAWITTKSATCTATGIRTRTCTKD
ncbi:MAG: hypothetical protein FWG82_04925, partial [Oscillospiraceae bacterium]|nr:hypothetical protein [Oscillospiraceae bacterium]